MYACVSIIYGIPLVGNDPPTPYSVQLEACVEDEEDGFITQYSGSADENSAAFGVELGEFDEAAAFTDVASLPLIPNIAQTAKFNTLWAQLAPKLQAEITRNYGAPRVFFLWSTS